MRQYLIILRHIKIENGRKKLSVVDKIKKKIFSRFSNDIIEYFSCSVDSGRTSLSLTTGN